MSLYEEVKKLNVREVIYTPGLGYTPVIVRDVRVLSKDALEVVKRYVDEHVPREVYTYVADPEYVEALKSAGFTLKSRKDCPDYLLLVLPIIMYIYGYDVKGDYIVEVDGLLISYPPWGYYNNSLKRIYVLETLADKLPLIVHEATHYAIDVLGLEELRPIREEVARLNEVLVAFDTSPIPVKRLAEALKDEKIVQQLINLVERLGNLLEPETPHKNLRAFINAVIEVEYGGLHPETLVMVLRGELHIEADEFVTLLKRSLKQYNYG